MAATGQSIAWRLPVAAALAWAAALGVAMSTQYFFQPFVWRNWPLDEIMLGWLDIARDRVLVALTIGAALVAAGRLPLRGAGARALLLGAAMAGGALAGEAVLAAFALSNAAPDTGALVGRALRWIVVAGCVAAMFYLWRRGAEAQAAAQRAELRAAELDRQQLQTRLLALRSQIEPHFLFNTLATVRRLHHTDPVQGAALLGHFLAYLRMTLTGQQANRSTLGVEVDMVDAYLRVVALRMSGRLEVHIVVPAELRDTDVPPLALATLVENAVKHGIGPCPDGGVIEVCARAVDGLLEVDVNDTGAGFSAAGSGGSGIGLANIRARLATMYGAAASLTLAHHAPRGVHARLRIPIEPARPGRFTAPAAVAT
jgi:hypothetical protein